MEINVIEALNGTAWTISIYSIFYFLLKEYSKWVDKRESTLYKEKVIDLYKLTNFVTLRLMECGVRYNRVEMEKDFSCQRGFTFELLDCFDSEKEACIIKVAREIREKDTTIIEMSDESNCINVYIKQEWYWH